MMFGQSRMFEAYGFNVFIRNLDDSLTDFSSKSCRHVEIRRHMTIRTLLASILMVFIIDIYKNPKVHLRNDGADDNECFLLICDSTENILYKYGPENKEAITLLKNILDDLYKPV